MTARDYPITFPYGATDDTYYGPEAQGKSTYIGPFHRGDDRYMPIGTPVVVNGVTIGISGVTGAASGPHLHIGKFVNGKDTNPNGGGFTLKDARVFDTGHDDVNGNYVRIQDGDGALWVYLHLSNFYVTKGQILSPQEDDMATRNHITNEYIRILGRKPSEAEIQDWLDKDISNEEVSTGIWDSEENGESTTSVKYLSQYRTNADRDIKFLTQQAQDLQKRVNALGDDRAQQILDALQETLNKYKK